MVPLPLFLSSMQAGKARLLDGAQIQKPLQEEAVQCAWRKPDPGAAATTRLALIAAPAAAQLKRPGAAALADEYHCSRAGQAAGRQVARLQVQTVAAACRHARLQGPCACAAST